MDKSLIHNDWKYLCQFLPENLSELAKASGAVERWRNIRNGEELLRIILAYAIEDLSLRSTAAGEGLGAPADAATAGRVCPRAGVSEQRRHRAEYSGQPGHRLAFACRLRSGPVLSATGGNYRPPGGRAVGSRPAATGGRCLWGPGIGACPRHSCRERSRRLCSAAYALAEYSTARCSGTAFGSGPDLETGRHRRYGDNYICPPFRKNPCTGAAADSPTAHRSGQPQPPAPAPQCHQKRPNPSGHGLAPGR